MTPFIFIQRNRMHGLIRLFCFDDYHIFEISFSWPIGALHISQGSLLTFSTLCWTVIVTLSFISVAKQLTILNLQVWRTENTMKGMHNLQQFFYFKLADFWVIYVCIHWAASVEKPPCQVSQRPRVLVTLCKYLHCQTLTSKSVLIPSTGNKVSPFFAKICTTCRGGIILFLILPN